VVKLKKIKREWVSLLVKVLCMFFIINIPINSVRAGDFDQPVSEQEKELFKQMFKPLLSLFNMIKFLASIVAGVYLSWGAVNLMTAGDDFKKRETAKQKLSFAVLGMMIIWGIPYFMQFMFLT